MSQRKKIAAQLREEASMLDAETRPAWAPWDDGQATETDRIIKMCREAADLLMDIDELAQTVADNLMPVIPARWGAYSTEVTLRAGMTAQPAGAAVTVRATIGPNPCSPGEICGVGPDLATALVDLHNRAREVVA